MDKNRRTQRRRRAKKRRLYFLKQSKARFREALQYLPIVGKWALQIGIVCLLAFMLAWYFGQRVSTVGDSMKPVLENGDVVLVNRIVYNAVKPKRGDIIVFKPKGNDSSHYYIKRVIGLPGETVEILEDKIYIDGEKLEESYEVTAIDDVGVVSGKMELSEDEYFVLGDDRGNSEDSRNADVGNVRRAYIYGKAWFVISPRSSFGFIKE